MTLARLIATGVLIWMMSMGSRASSDVFAEAQAAAQEGRYNDVVSLLSSAIEEVATSPENLVIAYSNRGIAYSLLKAYGLAKKDLKAAIELDPNHQLTQNHLGILAEHVDGNLTSAANWYGRAARGGFAASQVNLGNLYRRGAGVTRDYKKALQLYQAAADQGYSLAFVPIGLLYQNGEGVTRDTKKAVEWFRKAAAVDVPSANYYLGLAHEQGRGVPRNFVTAARYYENAAMQGHGQAQNALGYLHRRGSGVKQNYEQAMQWYQLAADQGVKQAMNRMAWLLATCPDERYCDGLRAVELARASLGDDPSVSYLDTLAAAHARAGQFDQAIAVTETILKRLPAGSGEVKKFQRRISIYEQGIPYQL